jgi:hypothetical protein
MMFLIVDKISSFIYFANGLFLCLMAGTCLLSSTPRPTRGTSSAAAIDRHIDSGGAAIRQAGTADQFVPDCVAGFGLESHVQRYFLGKSAVAAEAFQKACACFRGIIGFPGTQDGLPQRSLERLVLFVKTVLPFQE